MEEYSRVSSFWDRSLFYAAASDIAHRPLSFTAEQLVRALHALYASGVKSPQPFDALVSALLKAARSADAPGGPPQPQPQAPATAAAAASSWRSPASAPTAAAPASFAAAAPFAAAPAGPRAAPASIATPPPFLPTAAADAWGRLGLGAGGPLPPTLPASGTPAAGMAQGGSGLTLRQLQSVYSVLRAVEHPQASAFSQEFLQSSRRGSTF
uniref:Uncharacterized protein n=2 Tax=Dunaliella tertiolecta TaxID=3047 RepID=A0A7S3R9S2_DUNTE|mmetsp:Transcript_28887/g.77817  ORF Transcript_28887/g.77817 Transcript_28887/m.77817 type:complete len:211 (+) Transcript_28887:139-771(+)